MLKFFIFSYLFFSYFLGWTQNDISSKNWKILSSVSYTLKKDPYGDIHIPKFGDSVRKLEGQMITLEGFIVPFEGLFKPKKIILSSLPIASCFFCGGSGPESVAEVFLKEETKYTAKPVRIRGRLQLNDSDANQLMYLIKEATIEIL